MYLRISTKLRKEITFIQPGELYVSKGDEIISTLLGSCVAVCLYDQVNHISGMNHFMLPGRISESDIFADKSAKYGITAINNLIRHLQKIGAKKEFLIAKIFGGGHVLDNEMSTITIPSDNVRLAKVFMEIEDIPIVEIDVGDIYTRKLFMDVKTGKVYLKKTTKIKFLNQLTMSDKEFALNRFEFNVQNKSINS